MVKMVLTFEWTDDGRGCGDIVAEREFTVKSEANVQKDIAAWVKEMYKADKGKHKDFEVCRRHGCKDDRSWVVYGTKSRFNWLPNFMTWAEMIMACTMNYLGWERDIEFDQCNGKGYTFVSRIGAVRKFKTLEALDQFIDEEMRVYSTMREAR